MISRMMSRLAITTILAVSSPHVAFAQNTPAFRVPVGAQPSSSTTDPVYAWLQQVGTCSTTCGTGTRSTTHQCQNVMDYDYAGVGYGIPESDASCTISMGPKPDDVSASCTVYTGCGYDWVRPAATQNAIPMEARPVGRIGCGLVNQKFSPYCQRTGGGTNVIVSAGDHRLCSSDRPDYDEVASGQADALGYDRDVTQVSACAPQDHDWKRSDFGSWSSECSTTATRTRSVTCERRFDGRTYSSSAEENAACGGSRPSSTEVAARYSSCSYAYDYSSWSEWSSGCDATAKRTRTAQCRRSNDGGQNIDATECSDRGVAREAVEETAPRYDSCSYGFKSAEWSAYSSTCSATAQRTRDVWCERSNGDTVADKECLDKGGTRPQATETSAQYGSCSHSWSESGFGSWSSGCSATATRTQSVTCRRDLDGAAVDDAMCSGTRPASSQTAPRYESCSYARGSFLGTSAWSSGCSSNAERFHSYACVRQDGTTVSASECTGRGVSVSDRETGPNYSACTYTLQDAGTGACQTDDRAPHYWRCIRNETGEQVSPSSFCGRANPTYDSCAYAWGYTANYTSWSNCQTSGTRSRDMTSCIRSDGRSVPLSLCSDAGNPARESQACTAVAQCESTRDNLLQYSCSGTVIASGGYSWSRYGGERNGVRTGDPDRAMQCFAIGGTCLARREEGWSDYGDPEGGGTEYVCTTGGGTIQSHTFTSDSFRQQYTEACEMK